jgi:hypothetical protein
VATIYTVLGHPLTAASVTGLVPGNTPGGGGGRSALA